MAGASVAALEAAAAHFREHGYVVLNGFLAERDLRPAQDELGLVFPGAEEYHGSRDPGLRARFAGRASAGADYFPFASVEWSLLGVSDAWDAWIDRLAANGRIGLGQGWHDFVIRATPRQLELLGFPPRGHRYWTTETWTAVCQRYPAADLSAFQPAGD
jgi:hypothetical protein